MRNAFQYPISSRARDIGYISPPAPGDIQVYKNTPQSFTAHCTDGDGEATAEVPAGWFSSVVSQQDADNHALEYAETVALSKLLCGTIQCSTRSGFAQLGGYSEYTSPSLPPKKYRIRTLSGGYLFGSYGSGACSGTADHQFVCTWSGTCSYDKHTLAFTSNGIQRCNNVGDPVGPPRSTCIVTDGGGDSVDFTYTPTSVTASANGTCSKLSESIFWNKSLFADEREVLTDEDTEADALARLFPDDTGWSDFASPDDTGCCLALMEHRGPGVFGFAVRQVRYKARVENLFPGSTHVVPVKMMRRLQGSTDPFVHFATQETPGVADSSGVLVVFGEVENSPGYETFALFGGNTGGLCGI